MNLKTIVKYALSIIIAIEGIALVASPALKITPAAEARCVRIGTRGGMPILKCTGGQSCCRKTGRTKVINGKRYHIMDCSRCRR